MLAVFIHGICRVFPFSDIFWMILSLETGDKEGSRWDLTKIDTQETKIFKGKFPFFQLFIHRSRENLLENSFFLVISSSLFAPRPSKTHKPVNLSTGFFSCAASSIIGILVPPLVSINGDGSKQDQSCSPTRQMSIKDAHNSQNFENFTLIFWVNN